MNKKLLVDIMHNNKDISTTSSGVKYNAFGIYGHLHHVHHLSLNANNCTMFVRYHAPYSKRFCPVGTKEPI